MVGRVTIGLGSIVPRLVWIGLGCPVGLKVLDEEWARGAIDALTGSLLYKAEECTPIRRPAERSDRGRRIELDLERRRLADRKGNECSYYEGSEHHDAMRKPR